MALNLQRLFTWGITTEQPMGRPNAGDDLDAELEQLYGNDTDLDARVKGGILTPSTWAETDIAPPAADVLAKINELVNAVIAGAPGALDTLNELATALGDDANFSTTITNALAARYLKTEIDAFFAGESGGKKQIDFANVLNVPSTYTRRIGEHLFTEEKILLSATDPWFDVRSADQVLSTTNFSQAFIDHLRNVFASVIDGTSSFSIASWTGDGATVTLTLSTNSYTDAILAAIAEAYEYYGQVYKLGCVVIPSAIGDLPAGDYTITGFNSTSRTVSIPSTVTGASGTGTANFAPRRIAGSATSAQWFQLSEVGFMIGGGALATGYPVRDQFQGHTFSNPSGTHKLAVRVAAYGASVNSTLYKDATFATGTDANYELAVPSSDQTNGAPRIGLKTRGPAFAIHVYKYTGGYTP